MTFEEWMELVDHVLVSTVGMESMDLCDAPYRDFFDAGERPQDAAHSALIDYNDFDADLLDELGATF